MTQSLPPPSSSSIPSFARSARSSSSLPGVQSPMALPLTRMRRTVFLSFSPEQCIIAEAVTQQQQRVRKCNLKQSANDRQSNRVLFSLFLFLPVQVTACSVLQPLEFALLCVRVSRSLFAASDKMKQRIKNFSTPRIREY